MLYHVRMDVTPPRDLPPAEFDRLKAAEKSRSEQLQRDGVWLHLWRIVGAYANVSVFEVPDHDTLHGILSTLPLFPFMTIAVTPLARHPSAIG